MTDAIALIQAGQLDRARHALTRHLAILPDDVEARRLLGALRGATGDRDGAASAFNTYQEARGRVWAAAAR